MFLRNKINFVTLKSRFGGRRSRLPHNGYIRQLGETSWGPPGRKLCYVKSHFGGTRSRFPRNGYIRQSGESCRVEARQGETSRGPPRLATNESTPQLASPRLVSIAKKADSSRLASPRRVDSPSRLASCSSLVLTHENVGKNIFEILQNVKIVSTPIFRADSKSFIHFVIQSTLTQQIKKPYTNDTYENIHVYDRSI